MTFFLLRLAARNLLRQRRRTILTFAAISFGLAVFIIIDSMMGGVDRDTVRNLIDLETGHIKVHTVDTDTQAKELTLEGAFAPAPVLQSAEMIPGVAAATPRLRFAAVANTGWEEMPVVGIGIDPVTDGSVFTTAAHLEGRPPQSGQLEATLGESLAEVLELAIGDSFTLVTRTKSRSFQALDLTITGLINSPHPTVNQSTVFVPLDIAGPSLDMDSAVTEVAIRLSNPSDSKLDAAAAELRKSLRHLYGPVGDVRVSTWEDLSAGFRQISAMKRQFGVVFMGLILLIATVGVVNSVLLGAMERTREIGMMRALGMRESEVVREFLLEALGIGVLGGLMGLTGAMLVELFLVNYGIDLTGWIGEIETGYPMSMKLYGSYNLPVGIMAFVFGVAVSLLAAYIPARRAAELDPVVALRHE